MSDRQNRHDMAQVCITNLNVVIKFNFPLFAFHLKSPSEAAPFTQAESDF